jgi:hypothetical protein
LRSGASDQRGRRLPIEQKINPEGNAFNRKTTSDTFTVGRVIANKDNALLEM